MNWFSPKRIYLDYAAATPVLPEVKREMEKYFSKDFYNPNAIYEEGVKVRKEVEGYRKKIAEIVGSRSKDVIFTSGATEANRIASQASKSKHLDATQLMCYQNVTLGRAKCDSITISSPKIYGPKGIGALIVRNGLDIEIPERGTPPVPLIVGFAKALEIAVRDRETEYKRLDSLSAWLADEIKHSHPELEIIKNSPNILHISVPGVLPELLVLALDRAGILVSAGPACESNKPEPVETPVRFSLGRFTTESDIKKAAKIFCEVVQNLLK